jgi:3-hydroxyisobutyrate dehydrogenase-like beta-hydroxyacid dehydrogenase
MKVHRFGLIGHGSVGSVFARLLREREAGVISYDILLDREDTAARMRKQILADGARPGTLEEAIRESEYVLAIAPPQACRDVAVRASGYLQASQVYCDFASTSPSVKREVAAIVIASGAQFVEGAILGAVDASLACPAILLGGTGAEAAAGILNHYGLRTRLYSLDVGRASAFKMIRSVFSKGMEALLIETLLSARRADLLDEVWDEIRTTLGPDRMERTLKTWIRSHAISSERRYCEILEVKRFMEELKLEPILTRATADVFHRSNELGMPGAFEREPAHFTDVIDYLDRRLEH